jgi:hypothetical protein
VPFSDAGYRVSDIPEERSPLHLVARLVIEERLLVLVERLLLLCLSVRTPEAVRARLLWSLGCPRASIALPTVFEAEDASLEWNRQAHNERSELILVAWSVLVRLEVPTGAVDVEFVELGRDGIFLRHEVRAHLGVEIRSA